MKKLLFLAAIATLGLTTSCKKSCDSCTVKITDGTNVQETTVQGKDACDVAKDVAKITGRAGSETEVTCQ